MSTLHGWDHRHSSQVPKLWLQLIRAHDQIFSEANKALLKRLAIAVSIVGFAVHLVLVFLSRGVSYPPLILSAVGRSTARVDSNNPHCVRDWLTDETNTKPLQSNSLATAATDCGIYPRG